jgi:predicted nucleotidyltransferase
VLAILRAFKEERAEEFGILELGLFGSMARNVAGADSYVDVCIRTRTPDGFAMVHIRDELEARLGRRMDVVRVRERMNPLFWSSPFGKERLDGLCMLFAAIDESLKKLDRIAGGDLLSRYPGVDWKGAMSFRDFIAHHYFDIRCRNGVPCLHAEGACAVVYDAGNG